MNLKKLFLTAVFTSFLIFVSAIEANADSYRAGKFTVTIDADVYVGCDRKNKCIRLENGTKWRDQGYRGITWENGDYAYSISWREDSQEKMYLNIFNKDKRIFREKLVPIKKKSN